MINPFKRISNLVHPLPKPWQSRQIPLVRPSIDQLARSQNELPQLVQDCVVAQKYVKLLGPIDWSGFPERADDRAWPGPAPHPRTPYVAAYLVKLNEQIPYLSGLRRYLLEHPALVWVLGFPLVPSLDKPWGFDVSASVPTQKQFIMVLKQMDNQALQYLLDQTVTIIRAKLPPTIPFGQAISLDTKHIIAWVKENNPKVFIKEGRHDPKRQPKGDADCKLGTKKSSNQKKKKSKEKSAPPKTPTKQARSASQVEVGQMIWGYGSGVVATKVPDWGEVVLAELTKPFNESDNSYFFPLLKQAQQRLGFAPPFGAYDAAFDAAYVYDYHHQAGGFAAVPFVEKGGKPARQFDDQRRPLCAAGLGMIHKSQFTSYTGLIPQPTNRFACPLFYPEKTGKPCPINHKNWAKGGCISAMGATMGAYIRYVLDRKSTLYKTLYNQRTATERINSQAKALGIERPKLRNQQAIANQNTLIYVLINLRAYHRIAKRNP